MRFLAPISAALAVLFFVQSAAALERAGRVERQKGAATRTQAADTYPLDVRGGIFVGDIIETGAGSRLLIRFSDSSSLTLGENAKMIIDEMVYEPSGLSEDSDRQSIEFVQGVFRFVSGKIGKVRSQDVTIATPVATIGIRGTTFVGGELTVGMPPGQPHYGFQILEGEIEVMTPLGSVVLDEPGEGTFLPLTRAAAPTPVRQWTEEEAAEAREALAF